MNNKQLLEIKDLIKNNKRDRFIIFDNDEPALVVMSVSEYKQMAANSRKDESSAIGSDINLVDNINRVIAEWKVGLQDEEMNKYMKQLEEINHEGPEEDSYENDENLSYYYDMDEVED